MFPQHRSLTTTLTCCFLALGAILPAFALTRDVPWHPTPELAQSHASASGKPILAFVYQPKHKACAATIQYLLPHEAVLQTLREFELLAVDTHDPLMRNFCLQHKLGIDEPSDPLAGDHSTVQAVLPVYLILTAQGRELCRDYGQLAFYKVDRDQDTHPFVVIPERVPIAAMALATRLQQMLELARLEQQLQTQPSASAHAQAGHVLMELGRHEKARYHLQAAMQLDPDNAAGAYENAYLDVTILDIVDDAQRCLQQLQDYERRYATSDRLLEVRYYQAVCYAALEDYKNAGRLLQTFETADRNAPEYDSPWTTQALSLLEQLRDRDLY